MLFIIGALVTLAAVVTVVKVRVPGGVDNASLGWVSEQWLAEHRMTRPS
jgi:hypothetical protein